MSRPDISCLSWLGSLTLSNLGLSLLLLVLTITRFNEQTVRTENKTLYTRNCDTERYDAGKAALESYKRNSENPQYGECWTHALTKVYATFAGCKRWTDDEQSQMAKALTYCHLQNVSLQLFPSEDEEPLETCLSPMGRGGITFNVFTEFFTHTQDICFFLQSQVWHEQTEETISKLAKSSEAVVDQLEVTSHLQSEMMKKQNASMKNQEEILKNEEYLWKALNDSAEEVYILFEEMKSSIFQQKLLLDATFERLAEIQRLILGEFTWIHSLLFYMAAILISYLLTSTPRTSGARLWMCLVFLLSWYTERAVFSFYKDTSKEIVYEKLWLCRNVFIVMAIIVLINCLVRYKDYKEMNHKLLLELNDKLGKVVMGQSRLDDTDSVTTLKAVKGPTSLSAVMPPYNEDHNLTYTPDKLGYSSDSDTDSYASALPGSRRPSRPPSPVTLRLDKSTSAFNNTEIDSSKMTITSSNGEISVTVKKRGRPKGSKNSPLRGASNLTRTSFTTPYNLRSRRSFTPNPLLDQETVDMFIEKVERRTRRKTLSPAEIKEIY